LKLCELTVSLLKEKLDIPKSYSVFFISSATECWEIIAQSLVEKKSTHLYNGAFGEKWFQYTQRLRPYSEGIFFNPATPLVTTNLKKLQTELICVTQNETSNGTQIDNTMIRKIRKNNPEALIAVDATSSMAGVYLDFRVADIWFASVQKCFGLPAGLAIMVCSPRSIERAQSIGEKNHYNSLVLLKAMMDHWQTTHTPNVLGIYLLMRVLQKSPPIHITHQRTTSRAETWIRFFRKNPYFSLLIENSSVQSFTVICITCEANLLTDVKKKARAEGFILGEGYGSLRKETFRIANFPALKNSEITRLKRFFNSYMLKKQLT
jgi:phosphoserine aminotransferase